MSSKVSTPQIIPWNWVIEALANVEQMDSSALIGLVKRAPAISDGLGKDAREIVSLRILESLFVEGKEATVDADSAQKAKIGFDPSERCEDVLQQIVHETSELNELEKKKWDVHPFIMSKRSSLPKCALRKLKEAMLEGSRPLLASLKERSKLVVGNRSEDISPGFDGNCDPQITVAKDNLVSLNPGNENNKVQENLLHEVVEGCTRGTKEHTGREECQMSIELPIEGLDENTLMNHNEHASSKKFGRSCDVANTMHDQRQIPGDKGNVPQYTYREGQDRAVMVDCIRNSQFVSKLKDAENSIQPNALNAGPSFEAKNSMEHDRQLETGTDSDRSDDERTDIASKKEAFLSSQCTLSQDSMPLADWTEINLCMKCNGGGQLLVCSSAACPLRVHESCLGFAATLDKKGKFFCPFCAYSRAISKYLEVKKKASLARKDLQAFFSLGVKCRPKISAKTQSGSGLAEQMEPSDNQKHSGGATSVRCMSSREDPILAKSVVNDLSAGEKGPDLTNAEDFILAEPSRTCVNSDPLSGDNHVSATPSGGDGVFVANGTNLGLAEAEGLGQKKEKENRYPMRMENQQLVTQAASSYEPKASHSECNERYLGIGEHAEYHVQSGFLDKPISDLPEKPISQPRTPTKKYNGKGIQNPVSSSYSRILRKRKPQYTYPAVPSLRRKILAWTKLEEEKLKEGVETFSSATHKGIPWTEILDFGHDVFHKGRTTIDLKDKWRNICKGSPKPK